MTATAAEAGGLGLASRVDLSHHVRERCALGLDRGCAYSREAGAVSAPKTVITIDENTPAAWARYRAAELDVVPDPMVLRAGELFIGGRRGAANLNLAPDDVWSAIDRNLGALLTFFDLLVTRRRLPYLQYWETFYVRPERDLTVRLGSLLVPVRVEYSIYQAVLEEVAARLRQAQFDRLPEELVKDVDEELGAFAYDWRPPIDLGLAEERRLRVAQFMAGGMVFGAYAQAAGCDHVIQSKRSRLFLELSLSAEERGRWGAQEEERLFAGFRAFCASAKNLRAQEFPSAPTVLPHLLRLEPRPKSPDDLLERCLHLRESEDGQAYRRWFHALRDSWSRGEEEDRAAQHIVRGTLDELRARLETPGVQGKEIHVDVARPEFEAEAGLGPVPHASVKVKGPLKKPPPPRWLRTLTFDKLPFNRHRRLLLRMAADQARMRDISIGLRRIWDSA